MGSNRTFMELKSRKYRQIGVAVECSNRTFMELKSILELALLKSATVLIVPLWN